ncbi:hypothetical protein WOSG25_160310 [Weissella oryzae SG25]|uniref:Integrase catalytic domain-containing protein n=1 Tax=Weissella oryzae (strain DSM 25784 / JCM 18191 / LMG 30913 / SG25) TaxID=1329250 RepID=A0A069D367_WEIOS|nr:IS3 family transposase [Weissella oryzae]GAK31816.1 hypothetical protein WOSG25_160310 [Weissella oryzae SG25]
MPLIKDLLAQGYLLTRILKALNVNKSTYFNWLKWVPSPTEKRRLIFKKAVMQIWSNNKMYGHRRISMYSKTNEQTPTMSNYMALKLMRQLNIRSIMVKRYRKPAAKNNYVQRENIIKKFDDLSGGWSTDITYLQLVNRQWVYLATAYNPETRSVLSYKIGKQMTSELALAPILDALKHFRNPHIIHSDMGSQYTSFNFEDVLKTNKIKHSYSLKGYPYDNGRIEAFHSILKREMIYQRKFRSIDEIQLAVGNYIYWFNNERISFVQ